MIADLMSSRDVKCYEWNGGWNIKKLVHDFHQETT